ncbi:MAG TPA: HAD family hydrolase [Gammaproteobacteria bacterium]|nr:HAD family hydrolase [Gammaproteobacteria bacterium]
MTELKALIFDVDGTLANTEEAHRQAFNHSFKMAGLDWVWDVELYTKLLKVTGGKERIRYYVERFLKQDIDQAKVAALHLAKNERYQAVVLDRQLPLRPGIKRLIEQARAQGLVLAIATTTSPGNVNNLIKATLGEEALGWFAIIAEGELVPVKKPAPDVYAYVLEQLGLSANECLALEDSYNGVQAATCISIPTLITSNNYTVSDDFTGAMMVVDSLGDEVTPAKVLASEIDLAIDSIVNLETLIAMHRAYVN